MYTHPDYHEPSVIPVLNCPDCDREINRPVPLCFGDGQSTTVIPRPPSKKK